VVRAYRFVSPAAATRITGFRAGVDPEAIDSAELRVRLVQPKLLFDLAANRATA
jgi:hypothetical protein